MKQEEQNIGELFKDAFDGFAPEVEGNPWANIEQQLQAKGLQSASSAAGKTGLLGKIGLLPVVAVGSGLVGAALFYVLYTGPTEPVAEQPPVQPTEEITPALETPEVFEEINTDEVIEELNLDVEEPQVTNDVTDKPVKEQVVIKTQAPEAEREYNPTGSAVGGWITKHNSPIPYTNNNTETGTASAVENPTTTDTDQSTPDVNDEQPVVPAIAVVTPTEEAPNALIEASTMEGYAPLTVNFTNPSFKAHYWDFDDGNASTEANPSHTFTEPGTYTVIHEVTGESGTVVSDYMVIEVKEGSSFEYDENRLTNVFTPNGDGDNDLFIVPGIRGKNVKTTIEVYSSLGKLLYKSNSLTEGWDGRDMAGDFAPEGTYYYLIIAEGIDGNLKKEIKGQLTLQR